MEVDPQYQEQGGTTSLTQQLPGQVPNKWGGHSYKTTLEKRLKRFLCLGTELKFYRAGQQHSKFRKSDVRAIDKLIHEGRGSEVIQTIRNISLSGRAFKQDPTIFALAVCARSNCRQTKTGAYSILSEVCRIPTHLFQFIKYCENIDRTGSGWGRAHRMAISEWYKVFTSRDPDAWNHPKRLAYLVTKYQRRHGLSHKDVIRLAHVRARHRPVRIIVQHILGKELETPNCKESQEVYNFLQAVREGNRCQDAERMRELIVDNRFSREQVPNRFLKNNVDVWNVLLRDMPLAAFIRNLSKISSLAPDNNIEAMDLFLKLVEGRLSDEEGLRNARIHPLQLLIASKHYDKGHSFNDTLTWEVNPRISLALENAFLKCPKIKPPTDRRYLMAVSIGETMNKTICRSTIKASEAAAAMILSTLRTENVAAEVILFSDDLEDACIANVDVNDTLEDIVQKIFEIPRKTGQVTIRQDLSIPFRWAFDRKEKFDAIMIFTDSVTSCGHIHPAEALKQYSSYLNVPDCKFVVVSMTSNKYALAAPSDRNTLDVVGFDIHTPGIITSFLNDFENETSNRLFSEEETRMF